MSSNDPITRWEQLEQRVKQVRKLVPGAQIFLIQPCLRCGLNLWDLSHHDESGACRYPAPGESQRK